MPLYTSLHNQLKDQHQIIEQIVSRVDGNRQTLFPAAGKWSIKDNIAHLAKYQPIFTERINTILNTNEPHFGRYKAEDDLDFETWKTLSTEELLKRLNKDRQTLFNLIAALSEVELDKTGYHIKFGKLTIIQWTEFFLLHEAHHIFTIFQLANDVELKNDK